MASPKHKEDRPEDRNDDIVWGAREIGKVINRTARQAYYLLEQKRLPARCDNGMYSASRQKLLAHVSGENNKPLDAA
jgi:hypothetical protein